MNMSCVYVCMAQFMRLTALENESEGDVRGMRQDVCEMLFCGLFNVHGMNGVHVLMSLLVRWASGSSIFLASYALFGKLSVRSRRDASAIDCNDLSHCANAAATWSTVLT